MGTNNQVFAFEVSVKGPGWTEIVNARTAGQAKSQYFRTVRDAWEYVPYTAMRAKKIGSPQTSQQFIRNAAYRGMPLLRCGQRVQVGPFCGVVVSHNDSANFDVLFDDDSSKYAGIILSVHPSDLVKL